MSLEEFALFLDKENCDVDLVRDGKFASSWLISYYLLPENSQLKQLIEKENDVVYSPKVLQCKKCLSNARNFYFPGHCQLCSISGYIPKFLQNPKVPLNLPPKINAFSYLPNEFLFVVGRHTGGAPMDPEHRFRVEGVYYK
jgi:hypothetical protein